MEQIGVIPQGRIAVAGSINVDLVAEVDHLPAVGETIQSTGYGQFLGGKALNQAVAVQRLGGQGVMVGRVGPDSYADLVYAGLAQEGLDYSLVKVVQEPTGLAFITVDTKSGENMIVTVGGANLALQPSSLMWDEAPLASCTAIMLHWDLPAQVGERMIQAAKAANRFVVVSLAPYGPIAATALSQVDVLIVNEVEAQQLTNLAVDDGDCTAVLKAMHGLGVTHPVVTLGGRGVATLLAGELVLVPAPAVDVVDTVGAGDAFAGALIHCLQSMPWRQALEWAVATASLTVTKPGAMAAIPTLQEVRQRFFS